MKLSKLNFWLAVGALLFGAVRQTAAGEVNVAVAANFTAPAEQIAAAFSKETGNTVKLSFGASGNFYSQIRNGAPYDVFLAADEKNPLLLADENLAIGDTRFVYALGKLVLWSPKPGFVDNKGAVLATGSFARLSMADPKLAPYGLAAQQTLQHMNLWGQLSPKLVTGQNIAQTYQFAASGNAEMAFVALSQITKEGKVTGGSWWIVPGDSYSPIKQAAILLLRAKDNAAAQAFMGFLGSEKAVKIIRSFGYGLP